MEDTSTLWLAVSAKEAVPHSCEIPIGSVEYISLH